MRYSANKHHGCRFNLYAYDAYLLSCAIQQKAPLLTLDNGLRYPAQQANVKLLE